MCLKIMHLILKSLMDLLFGAFYDIENTGQNVLKLLFL